MSDDPQLSANQLYRVLNGQSTQPFYQLSPISADQRVQAAQNVRLLGSQAANGATSVAIGFIKPYDVNIDHFEIWVQRSAYSSENPYQVASVIDSPATFTVAADQNTVVIAFIRTIQKNGLATDLQASPTVTFNVTLSSGLVPASNITAGTFIAGVIYSGPINCSQLNAGTINVALGITSGTFTGSTLQLNLNSVTTTIANTNITGVGVTGVEVQDNASHDAVVHASTFLGVYNTDPSNNLIRASVASNGSGGIIRVADGSGTGQLGSGQRVILDGTNGNISFNGQLTMTGTNFTTANAGAATLPANPVGFLEVTFNGTTRKIPYYAV